MPINNLLLNPAFSQDKKLSDKATNFQQLISELNKKEIPEPIAKSINSDIDVLNGFSGSAREMLSLFRKKQASILKTLEKELKLVPKNHYRNLWLALGMSAFGLPLGVAFGISMGNLGLLGIGLPIGLGIGVALGTSLDKKAKAAGKQLDVEMKI
jgi:hypothetical protein